MLVDAVLYSRQRVVAMRVVYGHTYLADQSVRVLLHQRHLLQRACVRAVDIHSYPAGDHPAGSVWPVFRAYDMDQLVVRGWIDHLDQVRLLLRVYLLYLHLQYRHRLLGQRTDPQGLAGDPRHPPVLSEQADYM